MSRVTVDDTSSSIKYTGWWEPSWGSDANSAWDYGSQAIFSFKGTSVFVYGDVSEGKGEVVRVDFSIDGGGVVSKYQTSRQNKVTNVLWYESGNLPDGEHTLTMTYLPEDDMDFRLDRIEYTSSRPASHSSPPDAPQVVSTRTCVSVVVKTSTSSQVEVVSGTSVAGGSSTAGERSPGSSSSSTLSGSSSQQIASNGLLGAEGNQIITQTQYLPTAGATDTPSTGDGTSGILDSAESTSGSSAQKVPVGAIVGGVLGSLLFLCLIILAFITSRRRRRRSASYALTEDKAASSKESQPAISPFDSPATVGRDPAAQTSKSALILRDTPPHSPSDLTSNTGHYTASETGMTVVTEAAPSYMSGLGARFRENFTSEDGTVRTWAGSGVAESSHDPFGLPPAYG